MEWASTLKYAHISARKARLVADLVRGMGAEAALATLQFTPKKAAAMIRKVLRSAIGNASQSSGVDEDKLYHKQDHSGRGAYGQAMEPTGHGTSHTHTQTNESYLRSAEGKIVFQHRGSGQPR